MSFVDFLAFQQVTLLMAAVLVGYIGVLAAFAMRRNDQAGLKSILRSGAVPLGSLGAVGTILALWGEIAWPLPGSYNILFTDVYLLFGATLVILAVSMAASLRLQFAGIFALVAGGTTIAYGWAGYGLNMTKDPLETFLLYGAFGLTAILAFPATVMVDHYLLHPESSTFASSVAVARSRPNLMGASRAVQPVVPGTGSAPSEAAPTGTSTFRVPIYINATLIAFLVVVALAAVAALLYLNTTLPAHLTSAP